MPRLLAGTQDRHNDTEPELADQRAVPSPRWGHGGGCVTGENGVIERERPMVVDFAANADAQELLGGKGASLVRMHKLGIPVPPGFIISTEAWRAAGSHEAVPDDVEREIDRHLRLLERATGRLLGGGSREPLLVSVRSGAPVSMPGMMDTVLNLGMNDEAVPALAAAATTDFAYSTYLRLLNDYAQTVRGIDSLALSRFRNRIPVDADAQSRVAQWKAFIAEHGTEFPQDPRQQLAEAIAAVWRSWHSVRAAAYRRFRGIDDDLGTAVTVQAMVFGNLDDASGTGVLFTRDPVSGAKGIYGDFLPCAQGEDVVSGSVTPRDISEARSTLPDAFGAMERALTSVEAAYNDMCEIEFTIERGKLWVLQARPGQRSGLAAVRIAMSLAEEGVIDRDTALTRVSLSALEEVAAPVISGRDDLHLLAEGIPVSPGSAVGATVFVSERAEELSEEGVSVVLFRPETSPDDFAGMLASAAIVTANGGRASHAAVVARGIGRPAVCGIEGLVVDEFAATASLTDGTSLVEGEIVTVDGSAGKVFRGQAALVPPEAIPEVEAFMEWARARSAIPVFVEDERTDTTAETAWDPDAYVVEIEWRGADSNVELAKRVSDLVADSSAKPLILQFPDTLLGAELVVPDANWVGIACTPRMKNAATLLSTRIRRAQ